MENIKRDVLENFEFYNYTTSKEIFFNIIYEKNHKTIMILYLEIIRIFKVICDILNLIQNINFYYLIIKYKRRGKPSFSL